MWRIYKVSKPFSSNLFFQEFFPVQIKKREKIIREITEDNNRKRVICTVECKRMSSKTIQFNVENIKAVKDQSMLYVSYAYWRNMLEVVPMLFLIKLHIHSHEWERRHYWMENYFIELTNNRKTKSSSLTNNTLPWLHLL